MEGIIKVYFEDREFGFIIAKDGKEYFFHKSKIKSNKYSYIEKNMVVNFLPGESKKD